MKDYYEILDIEKTADVQKVKSAYFKKVRQYPPERFPQEFKEIREAYETLSESEKRAQYDKRNALPEDAKELFDQAVAFRERGQFNKANKIFQSIRNSYPQFLHVQTELGLSFQMEGKFGKAISVFKELCQLEPQNAEYILELAHAYNLRGWNRKAMAEYQRALQIDNSNVNIWMGLIRCYVETNERHTALELSRKANALLKEKGQENLQLLFLTCAINLGYDDAYAEECLQEMVRVVRKNPELLREKGEEMIAFLLTGLVASHCTKLFAYVQELSALLPHISEDLQAALEEVNIAAAIETLEEKGFSDLFYDLFTILMKGCDCEKCRFQTVSMECTILSDAGVFRPQLKRLKKEYPDLYDLHADFFDDVLTRNTITMLNKRIKILSKQQHLLPDLFGGDEASLFSSQEPVRREEPKIGRNDPCPCGSGKKYKKCCGA